MRTSIFKQLVSEMSLKKHAGLYWSGSGLTGKASEPCLYRACKLADATVGSCFE